MARKMADYSGAYQYFKIAAEKGNARAQYDLGYCYLSGLGVKQDESEGAKWLQKSAAQGDPQAQYVLGSCYENGWGVEEVSAKAKGSYQNAAGQGFKGMKTGFTGTEYIPTAKGVETYGLKTETGLATIVTDQSKVSAWRDQYRQGVEGLENEPGEDSSAPLFKITGREHQHVSYHSRLTSHSHPSGNMQSYGHRK